MHLRMTIETTAGQQIGAGRAGWQTGGSLWNRRVSLRLVALLTQKGGARFQKRRLRRAMRLMAIAAVFGNRLVLP